MCRIYRKSDPRFQPHLYSDGMYRLHRRDAGSARNMAEHSIAVPSREEVRSLMKSEKWTIRMSLAGRGPSPVIIGPRNTCIEDV